MKDCFVCGGPLFLFEGIRKGVTYEAYRCKQCGEVTFDMLQAENYFRAAEKAKEVTFSQWGQSLAIRIPKQMVKALHLHPRKKARIIAEKEGIRVIPVAT